MPHQRHPFLNCTKTARPCEPLVVQQKLNQTIIGQRVVIGVMLHFCEAGIPNSPNILMKTIHHSRTVFENPASTVQVYRNKTGQKSPLLVKTYHCVNEDML